MIQNAATKDLLACVLVVLVAGCLIRVDASALPPTTKDVTPGNVCGPQAGEGGKETTDPVDLAIADYQRVQTDLHVPGRGIDFTFSRTYRSRTNLFAQFNEPSSQGGVDEMSALGHGWHHSYEIYVKRAKDVNGNLESNFDLITGSGRCDRFETYKREDTDSDLDDDRFYAERPSFDSYLEYDALTETCLWKHADGTVYTFESVDVFPADEPSISFGLWHRLVSIEDRNGNRIRFAYVDISDAPNPDKKTIKLDFIEDTLGRVYRFSYAGPSRENTFGYCHTAGTCPTDLEGVKSECYGHLIQSITDESNGRTVFYDYGFPEEDPCAFRMAVLTKVTLPGLSSSAAFPVPTLSDQDYPADLGRHSAGRAWQYTYIPITRSTPVPLLLTATDPNGHLELANTYDSDDRVVRQDTPSGTYNYYYADTGSDLGSDADLSVYVNNRRGRVSRLDYKYAAGFSTRPEMLRRVDFTGFAANPSGQSSPSLGNMPLSSSKPRSSDPVSYLIDFSNLGDGAGQADPNVRSFFNSAAYNEDWLQTRWQSPNGDQEDLIYYRDEPHSEDVLNEEAQILKRRAILGRIRRDANSRMTITESWEYKFDFAGGGCCSSNFATKYIDGNGNATTYSYNVEGDRTAVTYPNVTVPYSQSGIMETFGYGTNSDGRVRTHTHPSNGTNQRQDAYEYASNPYGSGGNAYLSRQVIDVGGLELETTYTHDAAGNRRSMTDPDGDWSEYLYDQANQLVRQARYSSTGQLLAMKDYYYDAVGNLVRRDVWNLDAPDSLAANEKITIVHEYDNDDRLISTSIEVGDYDDDSNPIPLVAGPSKAFDASGFVNDPKWSVTQYGYNADDLLTEIKRPEAVDGRQPNNRVTMEYDSRLLLFRRTEGPGSDAPIVTEHSYDEKGRRVQMVVDPGGLDQTTTFTYDGFDRLLSQTDPMGNVTSYTYDNNDNLLTTRVVGAIADDTLSTDDATLLAYSEYRYDQRNRRYGVKEGFFAPISGSQSAPTGSSLVDYTTKYNPNDSVAQIITPNGNGTANTTTYTYDTASRVSTVEDAAGGEINYTYYSDSNILSTTQTDELGRQYRSQYTYDALNRQAVVVEGRYIVGSVSGPNNLTVHRYDSRGNLLETIDPRGNITGHEYDGLNRLVATTVIMSADGAGGSTLDPFNDSIRTEIEYDDSSRVTRRIDDNGNVTAYLYDELDREVVRRMADGTIHQAGMGLSPSAWASLGSPPSLASGFTSGYDAVGNLVTMTDANETVATATYDAKNRRKSLGLAFASGSDVVGTTAEEYDYDGLGRITRAENDFAKVLREYDSREYVTSEVVNYDAANSFPAGSDEAAVVYTYDAAGNEEACTYPSGRVVYKSYDELNRLVALHEDASKTDLIASYEYAGGDRVSRRVHGNGTEAIYEYSGYYNDPGPTAALLPIGKTGLESDAFMQVRRIHHYTSGSLDPEADAIEDREYWWDGAGNKIASIDAINWDQAAMTPSQYSPPAFEDLVQFYSYDSADRLIRSEYLYPSAASQDGSIKYALDGVHNRVRQNEVDLAYPNYSDPVTTTSNIFETHWGKPFSPDYDAFSANGVDSSVNQYTASPGREFTYDDNGNLTINHDPDPADFDSDYVVDSDDRNFAVACASWGATAPGQGDPPDQDWDYCQDADLNGDLTVDQDDIDRVDARMDFASYNARLAYDYRNQLISYDIYEGQDLVKEIDYEYDAFNRRIRRTVTAYSTGGQIGGEGGDPVATAVSTNEYRYGGQAGWQLLEDFRVGPIPLGQPRAETFVYGNYIDEVIQKEARDNSYGLTDSGTDPDEYYFHQDDLFSVLAVTDEDGDVVERYRYSDYGEFSIVDNAGTPQVASTIGTLHTFTGRLIDPATGLLEYRHRWMSPTLGRFMQHDPLGFIDDMNCLTYAQNSPLNQLDSFGLQTTTPPAEVQPDKKTSPKPKQPKRTSPKKSPTRVPKVPPTPTSPSTYPTKVPTKSPLTKWVGRCLRIAPRAAPMVTGILWAEEVNPINYLPVDKNFWPRQFCIHHANMQAIEEAVMCVKARSMDRAFCQAKYRVDGDEIQFSNCMAYARMAYIKCLQSTERVFERRLKNCWEEYPEKIEYEPFS